MVIKINPKFNKEAITAMMAKQMAKIEAATLSRLQRIGEQFVADARNDGTYKDQTGNLRNSIGYVILKNGEQLQDNFRLAAKVEVEITRGKNKGKKKTTKGSANGKEKAMALIEELKANFPRGYVLIVVAGMDYAAAVESKGKDVLTGSSKKATASLRTAMQSIQGKI